MLTLSEARSLLSQYVGANIDFTSRLNLACERLIKAGNWRGSKVEVLFTAYPAPDLSAFLTLPRQLNTVLAIAQYPDSDSVGLSVPVRGSWYEFYAGGPGFSINQTTGWNRGIVPINGRFTTFADFTNCKLKIITEHSESGSIIFKGKSSGVSIYSTIGGTWQEGVSLTISNGNTTSQTFDTSPFAVIKPVTNGRIWLYAVAADTTETLIAIYEPGETGIAWPRYKVPVNASATAGNPTRYVAICKRAWVPLSRDSDEVIPGNLGALRYALQALTKEDAEDYGRANALWYGDTRTKTIGAFQLLEQEVEDDTGAGAEGNIQVSDDFHIGRISNGV
jgi:hypothetical protein